MSQLISIIIPFYNHGEYIEGALQSVFNQSYKNLEVIVINDGSSEEHELKLKKILKAYPKVVAIHQENQGPCVAKNLGVELSTGEIIGFLDSDNEFLPGYMEEAIVAIEKEGVDWFFGDLIYFGDKKGERTQKLKGPEEIFINSPIDNCFFIRKSIFTKVGGFDTHLSRLGLEDWELTVRLISEKVKYKHLEKHLFKYRVINTSRSANEAIDNKEEIIKYVFKKHHHFLVANYSKLFFDNLFLSNRLEVRIGNNIRKILKK